MKKHTHMVQSVCCIMVFLFVCSALLPIGNARANMFQTDEEKMFLESPAKKVKHTNYENESFFTFAIIWGTFEHKSYASLFGPLSVYNPDPWHNRTMNVIGYVKNDTGSGGTWTVKKAFNVRCNSFHIGFVGQHWLCVIGIGDVDAF